MAARLKELYNSEIKNNMMGTFDYKSVMQVPKVEKIVLNVGMSDAHSNPAKLNAVLEELSIITGQHAVKTYAKKSIANFKVREGMVLGAKVTLRGQKMYEFLDRLVNISLPRVRDFRGIPKNSFDTNGNYNFSIKEQIIFPEINFDKVDNIYGINITVVTTAKTKDEAKALLEQFNMPFSE